MSPRAVSPDLESNVLEVSAEALRHNVRELQRLAGPDCRLYAALKCDAYGFGLVPVAQLLVEGGVHAISVARLSDAVALREAGVAVPILLYAGAAIGPAFAAAVERHDVIPTVLDADSARSLARHLSDERPVFVKVDVGQRRLGSEPRQLVELAQEVAATRKLRLEGIYTHMTVPGDPVPPRHVERQFELFEECLEDVSRAGLEVPVRMAASSSVLRLTDRMSLNAIDPGRMYFGLVSVWPGLGEFAFRSALRCLRTRLLQVKVLDDDPRRPDPLVPVEPGMRIGIIPLGTSDGLPSPAGREVLVRGRRAPLIEPSSLEHCRVDLSGIPEAAAGDEVVVIGPQGEDEITIEEVARQRGLAAAPHNVPIGIRESVPRVYLER